MQENTSRLVGLINDLLDISRIESGKINLECTTVILHPLIRRVLQSFAPQIVSKHQHVKMHMADPSPVVFADHTRVQQIVSNLISNAHKYTLEGGILHVSTKVKEQMVWVTIQDSGIGMTPEELARLFTRFFRAKNQLTEEVGGTGLGLVITHSLVALQCKSRAILDKAPHSALPCPSRQLKLHNVKKVYIFFQVSPSIGARSGPSLLAIFTCPASLG